MDPGALHAGNNCYAKYEAACQQLENWGLRIDSGRMGMVARLTTLFSVCF